MIMALTKAQFLAKHKQKYAGLSAKEKDQRWRNYLASTADQQPHKRDRVSTARASLDPRGCLAEYLTNLSNPRDMSPVCLPIFPSPDSYKVKAFGRGSMEIGTGGFGLVLCRTLDGVANDNQPVYVSTSAWTGLSSTLFPTPASAGLVSVQTNSPYGFAAYGREADTLKYRVASAVLRIRYTGTTLNRSGLIRGLVSPQHGAVDGVLSYNSMAEFPHSINEGVDNNWKELLWYPVNRNETDYMTSLSGAEFDMVFAVGSEPGNSFEVEFFINFEVIGQNARGKTPSYSSPLTEAVISEISDLGSMATASTVTSAAMAFGIPLLHNAMRSNAAVTGMAAP
jgi:hypothetical protein